MIHIRHPLGFDKRGRTAATGHAEHVRALVEQLLFTSPGERVNRPDFGGGLRPLVFAPNSLELAAALQFAIQANLQRWLSDLIEVRGLVVHPEDESLHVEVGYVLRRTGETRTERFVGRA